MTSDDTQGMMRDLIHRKRRIIGTLSAIYLTSYVGLSLLAGFARPFLAAHAVGPLNLGFVLTAANYALAWILALIYVRIANERFDPLAARVAAAIEGRRS